eukprot:Gb_26834 [translate_table: standard]
MSSPSAPALPCFHLRSSPELPFPFPKTISLPFNNRSSPTIFSKPLQFSVVSSPSTIPKEPFDLASYWNSMIDEIDAELQKAVPLRYPQNIHESMRYSVLAKAKRAPPIMCIAACEVVGGSKRQALPTACALEMVHAASLIHDDLPCMDDDSIRRGQPSNHTVFGVDMAVLAGDALFPLGFEYIVTATSGVPADRVVKVIAQIARTVGSEGMVAGQYMDLESTGNNKIDPSLVEFIHERKFGMMAECSAMSGGILGGGSEEEVERLRKYGRVVGVLYQIVDDILEEEAILQGDVGVVKKNKASYPRAFGLEKAREVAETLRLNAKIELSGFDGSKAAPLYSFVDYAVDRKL